MLRAVSLALAVIASAALAAPAPAADFGRWRVTVSGQLHDAWQGSATTPCAISGTGAADLEFTTTQPVVVRLRRVRIAEHTRVWKLAPRAVLRLAVRALVSADARQQPPASEEQTCAWPGPATWACGPLEYTARQELLAGPAGVGLQDTHYFEFPPRAHEPEGRECGLGQAGSGADLPLLDPARGTPQPSYRLRPAVVAKRRRIVIGEHADGSSTGSHDEQPPFAVTDSRVRDTTIVLAPVP